MSSSHGLAHAIPSLTVEAVFKADRSYELKVNVDPRLFLSNKPTTLPPVESAWYRDQTPDQLKATEKKSTEYLASALSVLFSGQSTALPPITYQPMDGATNLPITAESKEVHLLATMQGQLPASAVDFALGVGAEANTSVILINSLDGKEERRPQVLFPGETSRPFQLPGSASLGVTVPGSPKPSEASEAVVTTVEVQEVSRTGPLILVLCVGAALALGFVLMRMVRR